MDKENGWGKYTRLRQSGTRFLGKIPEHWRVLPLKRVADIELSNIDKKSDPDEHPVTLCNYMDVYRNEYIRDSSGFMVATASDAQIKRLRLKKGDVLLTKDSESPSDIGVAAYVEADIDAVCGYHLAHVTPHQEELDGEFLGWLLRSHQTRAYFQTEAVGMTRYGLGKWSIANTPIVIPQAWEQRAIANYLRTETKVLDLLIAKQERLIDLLAERRQSVITHAVTKGITLGARMKPSGIGWLGDIPEHWEVKRLKHLGTAKIGLTYSPDDVVSDGAGILVLRASNIQGGRITFDDNVYVDTVIPQRLITQIDDLLICTRNGSRNLIGKNALIDEDSAGLTYGAFTTVFRSPINQYLYWYLASPVFAQQSGRFLTSTINQLTVSNLYSIELPVPPSDERSEIVSYLQQKTGEIDNLISKCRCAIDLLREHRASLISAVVTGKIRVTEEVGASDEMAVA